MRLIIFNILHLNLICLLSIKLIICVKFKTETREDILNVEKVIRVQYDAPEKPGDKENFGVTAVIEVLDHRLNKYVPYNFLIDSMSSSFWLLSQFCNSEICKDHNKYLPIRPLQGEATVILNTGKITGNIYKTSINLKNFYLHDQPLFLVKSITVPEYSDAKIDGIFGISKIYSNLHVQPSYISVLQNILAKKLPQYFLLRLGGSEPYIKFGYMDSTDWQYFKVNKDVPMYTERIEWLNLIEKGKLIVPLRHIRLIYRDSKNKITRWEFAFTHCIHHGCRTTLDTKAYFIYGPENQLEKLINIGSRECTQEYYQSLPDIEFSFYDIDVKRHPNISGLTVDLTLTPDDYMINISQNSVDDGIMKNCMAGFGDHGTQYGWNLGILFLRKFVLIYDFEKERVGFVRAKDD